MGRWELGAMFRVVLSLCMISVGSSTYTPKLLLISMDGFRWDYLKNETDTPNFAKLAKAGVQAEYVTNTFPTLTFPNHYTMVTGLYTESHGVVGNRMYDPEWDESFSYDGPDSKWWRDAEPIWVTAKKAGLGSASYYWTGSEAEIQGIRPDIYFPYSDGPGYEQRVDTIIDWFTKRNINVATLYFPEPDITGHRHGPDSPEVRNMTRYMDSILGYLAEELDKAGLTNEVNVIVTSDHGMTAVDTVNRLVDIADYVDMNQIDTIPSDGAVMQVVPTEGADIDAIVQNLTDVAHIAVYKKEDIPERFHYRHHRRITPIVIVADEGWLVTSRQRLFNRTTLVAQHGFDYELKSMKPIFLAAGPNFKPGFELVTLNSVDIYPLMCEILGLTPAPNNGSLNNVKSMLQPTPTKPVSGFTSLTCQPLLHILLLALFIKMLSVQVVM